MRILGRYFRVPRCASKCFELEIAEWLKCQHASNFKVKEIARKHLWLNTLGQKSPSSSFQDETITGEEHQMWIWKTLSHSWLRSGIWPCPSTYDQETISFAKSWDSPVSLVFPRNVANQNATTHLNLKTFSFKSPNWLARRKSGLSIALRRDAWAAWHPVVI